MSIIRHRSHEVPGLNTASLPDLIFSIIFFFMIVTHMRKVNLKVNYKAPQGTELTNLVRKTNTTYIFIGRPIGDKRTNNGHNMCIQVNDKVMGVDDLSLFLQKERRQARKNGEEKQITICLKADRNAPMSVIERVKLALREANMLNITYYATEKNTNLHSAN